MQRLRLWGGEMPTQEIQAMTQLHPPASLFQHPFIQPPFFIQPYLSENTFQRINSYLLRCWKIALHQSAGSTVLLQWVMKLFTLLLTILFILPYIGVKVMISCRLESSGVLEVLIESHGLTQIKFYYF